MIPSKRLTTFLAIALLAMLSVLAHGAGPAAKPTPNAAPSALPPIPRPAETRSLERATFAGGCFWCLEAAFEGVGGIVSSTSGYTGGETENPTYEEVSSGGTGHAESVQVLYDPRRISYEKLLDIYWHNIDPTNPHGQFCDIGTQYRSAIFTTNDAQKRLAEASKKRIEAMKTFSQPIATEIVPLKVLYPAEEYHQNFSQKEPVSYKAYRLGCGRDLRLEDLWGKAPEHK